VRHDRTTFRDSALHEIPPNGQGIAALMALGVLRSLGIEDLDPDGGEAIHLQIEAIKLALPIFIDMSPIPSTWG
jgi:gamma-glutamyltranspeptidase / glutathione hydrolase